MRPLGKPAATIHEKASKAWRNIEGHGAASAFVLRDQTAIYDRNDVTVLIPTLNEEKAIERVIQEVRECGFENILIVDGYSSDRTVERAKSLGVQVVYQMGRGKAMAVKTGLDIAKTTWILVMDGDGSYDPRDIDRMIYTAIEGGYDEVIGCRTDKKNMPLLRRFGNKVISILISLLMGHRIKDPCSGMYLLRSDFARRLEIAATGFDVEAEIACKSMAHGRVAEVPVRYRRRIGESKLKTWTAGFRIIWTALKVSRLYNPISLFTTLGSLVGFSSLAILIWQLYVRYIFREEACSIGWTWLGLALLILGVNAFALAITSLMLKGMGREAHADISKKSPMRDAST